MDIKNLLSSIAIILTFIAFIPYIRSILQNEIKPHTFSWITWSSTTIIVFIAQLSEGGGAGAKPIGISGCISIIIAILSYIKRADNSITKTDWIFFVIAMSAIPLWYFTSNPLLAVILLTSSDIIGFFPTIRKAYIKPFEEQIMFFNIIATRNAISIAALEYYSLTTILFPAAIGLMCISFTTMIMIRRTN